MTNSRYTINQFESIAEYIIAKTPVNHFFIERYIDSEWRAILRLLHPEWSENDINISIARGFDIAEFGSDFKNYLFCYDLIKESRGDLVSLTEYGKKLKKYKSWKRLRRQEDLELSAEVNDTWRKSNWIIISIMGFACGVIGGVLGSYLKDSCKAQSQQIAPSEKIQQIRERFPPTK